MKKNLIKSFALVCGMFVAMSASAQSQANSIGGLVVGDKFDLNGVKYQVTAISPEQTAEIIGFAEDFSGSITISSKITRPAIDSPTGQADPYNIAAVPSTVFNTKDITTVTTGFATPPSIAEDAFSANTYKNGTLVVSDGKLSDYNKAIGWKNFKKIADNDGKILGDVNGDGNVTNADAMQVLKKVLDSSFVLSQETMADVNGDGSITNGDAMGILMIVLK